MYRGNLIEGKMDGIGFIEYANKKNYIGEFKEGYKNGLGIMTWPRGEKYLIFLLTNSFSGDTIRTRPTRPIGLIGE